MNIFTYHLEKSLPVYVDVLDKAFNFKEFFRIWTGDINKDLKEIPSNVCVGDFVHENDSKTIAEIIQVEFPDTKLEDLITVIDRYKEADTWPQTTEFTEESFNLLQDIMINANQLDEKVNYSDLIYQK